MNSFIPVVLCSVFAAGCAIPSFPLAEHTSATEPVEPKAPDSALRASVDLHPPLTSLTSVIRMRPFGSVEEGTIMAIEAVIGQDENGQTWGCTKIYDARTEMVLTPSEYENTTDQTPGQIAGLATLHGRECAPVEAETPPSKPTESLPGNPALKDMPNPDAGTKIRLAPKAPLLHL
jgi:hypothetical protein